MLRSLLPIETQLIKLCYSKNWDQVSLRSQSHRDEAKPSHAAFRGMGTTALAIAIRAGAPLLTVRHLTEANVDQLVRVRHCRQGTVLHEAIKHGASIEIIQFLIEVVLEYEQEQNWHNRGELRPIQLDFSSSNGSIGNNGMDSNRYSIGENNDIKRQVFSLRTRAQETPEVSKESAYRQHYSHHTLFNQIDDLGRTPLHHFVLRATSARPLSSRQDPFDGVKATLFNDNIISTLDRLVTAFPPAVGKVDGDGNTPLILILQASKDHSNENDMEFELRIFEMVRLFLRAYPLASCPDIHTAKAKIDVCDTHGSRNGNRSNCNVLSGLDARMVDRTESYHLGDIGTIRSGRVMVSNIHHTYVNSIDGNISMNTLSHAILHSRHASILESLLESSKLASNCWYTGQLESKSSCEDEQVIKECMTIVTRDFEVPLHLAVTMRSPLQVISLLLNAAPSAVNVSDRCGLTPLSWIWNRHILDHIDVERRAQGRNEHANTHNLSTTNTTRRIHSSVKASKRRYLPHAFISTYENESNQLANGMKHLANSSNASVTTIVTNHEELSDILSLLLLHAATTLGKAQGQESTHEILSNLGSQTSWPLLHAACYVPCPRPIALVILINLLNEVNQSHSIKHPAKLQDSLGNLPLHYCAASQNYERNYPIGVTCTPTPILDPPLILDILSLFPEGTRICNADRQLPLHVAIDNEKKERKEVMSLNGNGLLSSTNRQRLRQKHYSILSALIRAYPEALDKRDGKTKVHPFQQAAVGDHANIDTVYILLKENPTLVLGRIVKT